jgi:hypothetical protein
VVVNADWEEEAEGIVIRWLKRSFTYYDTPFPTEEAFVRFIMLVTCWVQSLYDPLNGAHAKNFSAMTILVVHHVHPPGGRNKYYQGQRGWQAPRQNSLAARGARAYHRGAAWILMLAGRNAAGVFMDALASEATRLRWEEARIQPTS